MRSPPRARTLLAAHWPALAVGLYFCAWIFPGLRMGFSYDDVTNLYLAWVASPGRLLLEILTVWSSQSRPVGGLFYRGIYGLFGFNPLPFHVACAVLLLINFGFQYRLFTALGASRGVAWAALLAGCFHGPMWDIYTGIATIYDILCGAFYYAALLLYVTARRAGSFNAPQAVALFLLTLLALGSKEMALSLPLVLLLYEMLFHPPRSFGDTGRWALVNAARVGPPALVCLTSIAGRVLIKGPLTGNPAYTPVFTMGRLLETTTTYTGLLFDRAVSFSPIGAVLVWGVCVALGLWARSRLMLFGVLSFALGMLPMSFVNPRDAGYVFYVPMFGLALYAGAAFWIVRARLSALVGNATVWTVAFVCVVVWTHYSQGAERLRNRIGPGGQDAIRLTAERLPRVCPRLPPGSRVLLVNSPFGNETWVPGFTLGLLYHSKELHVVSASAPQNAESLSGPFDHTFAYRDGDIFEIK